MGKSFDGTPDIHHWINANTEPVESHFFRRPPNSYEMLFTDKDAWNWTWLQKYSCCRLFQSIADFRDHFYAMFPKKKTTFARGSVPGAIRPCWSHLDAHKRGRTACLLQNREWKVERNSFCHSCFSFELIASKQKFKLQSFGQQKQIPQGATSLLFRLSPSSSLLSAKRGPFRRPAVKTSWLWW